MFGFEQTKAGAVAETLSHKLYSDIQQFFGISELVCLLIADGQISRRSPWKDKIR